MKKFSEALASFILVLISSGCQPDERMAIGPEDEIYIVADSSEYLSIQPALEETFCKKIFTPQPENLFTLIRIDADEIEKIRLKKNILITAPLNSNSKTSKLLNRMIDSSAKKKLQFNSDFLLLKKDLWAKNQLLTVLTASSIEELRDRIIRNSKNLLRHYQEISDKRLSESLYNPEYEQKQIQAKLLKDYGWMMYVHADYKVARNKPNENFVWLRQSPGSDLERWIFIYWIDNASPEYLNADSVKSIRNRTTSKFYQTSDDSAFVIIAEDYFVTAEVDFNGRYSILTQGLWDLNVKGMGGPFINYTFFDPTTNRVYMIDGSIYAPKYYKRNTLQQIDVILRSFKTLDELSESRKSELLNSLN
ncbi:MAG: DUF4837 family protein [Ignavibacteriaceae bacterium]|nr:DUF4837 family protein [Ignavibacteriaceae bacterium]